MKIAKALKTELKAPLTASDTTLTLKELVDSKGNELAMSDFGDWGVVVIRQGEVIEMVKFDGLTQNSDGSATLDVASSGRHIDPTSPYAGYAEGEDFQSGAEAVISNDPLTLSRFANLDLENTFAVVPKVLSDPIDDDDLARRSWILENLPAGTVSMNRVVVAGNAGETVAAGNLIYFDTTDDEWKKTDADTAATLNGVLLGIAQGAGTNGNPIASGILVSGLDANQSGLVAGDILYASNTAGAIANSPGTNTFAVGIAKSATELYFVPGFTIPVLTQSEKDALVGTSGTPSGSNKFVTDADTTGTGSILRSTKGNQLFDKKADLSQLTDTSTETDMYSISVPASTLATGRLIRIWLPITNWHNNGGAGILTLRLKYGSTTLATVTSPSAASANNTGFIEAYIFADASASVQYGAMMAYAADIGNTVRISGSGVGTAAENSATPLTLKITAQLSGANGKEFTVGRGYATITGQ